MTNTVISNLQLPWCDVESGVVHCPHSTLAEQSRFTDEQRIAYDRALRRAWNLQRAIAVNNGTWKAADHPLQDIV